MLALSSSGISATLTLGHNKNPQINLLHRHSRGQYHPSTPSNSALTIIPPTIALETYALHFVAQDGRVTANRRCPADGERGRSANSPRARQLRADAGGSRDAPTMIDTRVVRRRGSALLGFRGG
jgi:hypothetical protein